jgi:hypothetical protein
MEIGHRFYLMLEAKRHDSPKLAGTGGGLHDD